MNARNTFECGTQRSWGSRCASLLLSLNSRPTLSNDLQHASYQHQIVQMSIHERLARTVMYGAGRETRCHPDAKAGDNYIVMYP
jgi:hypothetical protein